MKLKNTLFSVICSAFAYVFYPALTYAIYAWFYYLGFKIPFSGNLFIFIGLFSLHVYADMALDLDLEIEGHADFTKVQFKNFITCLMFALMVALPVLIFFTCITIYFKAIG